MPGIAAPTDPKLEEELYVLGWSKGYLAFTSTFRKASGKMQSLLVTPSTDGLHWDQPRRIDLGGDEQATIVTQLVEGPAGLLATGEQPGCALHNPALRMWRSADGLAWTPVDLEGVFGADSLPAISGGSAGYIALAASGDRRSVWTSLDGASWHENAMPADGFAAQSVASFGGGYVVAGATGAVAPDCGATTDGSAAPGTGSIWSSRDGSSWVAADLPGLLDGTETTMTVIRLSDRSLLVEQVAVSKEAPNGTVRDWTSSDGLTWRQTDALRRSLGHVLTDGVRTYLAGLTDDLHLEVRMITQDLRPVLLADTSAPVMHGVAEPALGPAGIVVVENAGDNSRLGVPTP